LIERKEDEIQHLLKVNMKPILPSLREKNRYIVFEVISKNKIKFDNVKKEIYTMENKMLGEIEMSNAGIMFLSDWSNQRGIIKVSNHYSDKIRIPFLFINKINNYDVIVQTRGISGILKKARGRFLYN